MNNEVPASKSNIYKPVGWATDEKKKYKQETDFLKLGGANDKES